MSATLWIPREILLHIASLSKGEDICVLGLMAMTCKEWALLLDHRCQPLPEVVDWKAHAFFTCARPRSFPHDLIYVNDRADLLERAYTKRVLLVHPRSMSFIYVKFNAIRCLEWMHMRWPDSLFFSNWVFDAIKHGRKVLLNWAFTHGVSLEATMVHYAMKKCNVNMAIWLIREWNCPYDESKLQSRIARIHSPKRQEVQSDIMIQNFLLYWNMGKDRRASQQQ